MKFSIRKNLLLLILIFLMLQLSFSQSLAENIDIALASPFTGLGSILGDYIKEGALLAVDEINAAGGVDGAKINVMVYDTQADPSIAANVVRRALFDDNVIAIFGPNMSSAVLGVHTLAQQSKVPMLVGATSPSFRYTNVGNDYLFRLRADDGVKVTQQVKYAVEVLGIEKPGIIYGSTDYCTAALEVAEEGFDNYGIEIVAAEQMREGDKDASGQILKLKNAGFDGLFGLTHEPEAAVVLKLMRQLEIDVPIIGFSAWGVPAFTDLAGDAAVGVYSVQGFNPTDSDPTVVKFVNAYKEKWGREPSDPSQCYYDGVYLLSEAIKLAGSTDGEKLAEALTQVEYTGVQGPMKCNEHHNFTDVCYISQFDGEKWEIIDILR
jgi:branched-chain amino acid transport system substrate-binding protein